ncbi:MAG: Eco57I restriction-modification methylase domain-containing protein, partial [Nitrospirota bacterium]
MAIVEPKGVVFTKRWVVELLLDLSGYCSDKNLADALAIEPAAGDGAFLGPMIERLVESCRNLDRSLAECEHSLIAYELNEASAARARVVARNILMNHGIKRPLAKRLADAWVVNRDYLLDADSKRADFVIGNPPYVRLEDISEDTASVYRNAYPTMRGRADLYVAFFEAALRQLKPGGVCAFICADRWMRNQYGAELRQLITSAYSVEMLLSMHHANAFDDDVDAYPAITVIRHTKQQSTVVASAGQDAENIQPRQLATTLWTNGHDRLPQGVHRAVVNTWFKGSGPWPCHSPKQLALLRRLEDQFSPLEMNAKVGIGVATGNDSVYITTDADLVEPSRLLKLALAKDLSSGTVRWSGHYLVNPWNHDGLVNLKTYPKLRTYYEQHAAALKKRHAAENSAGKWYKTIDRVNHALTDTHKLYIPDIKSTLEPVLDRGETYPHHNLYFIQSDEWDLEVLGGLLLSKVGQFFVESYGVRMRGGYLRFQAQYLRRIRVPAPATLSRRQSHELKDAFRHRDRPRAT